MHNIFIKVCKDSAKQWMKLPFVAIDDAIFTALETWPSQWHAPNLAELEKAASQKKKDNAKLRVTQLAEKGWSETAAVKERAAWEATQKAAEQKKVAEVAQVTEEATEKAGEDQETSSQGQEVEEGETIQGSVDLGTRPHS